MSKDPTIVESFDYLPHLHSRLWDYLAGLSSHCSTRPVQRSQEIQNPSSFCFLTQKPLPLLRKMTTDYEPSSDSSGGEDHDEDCTCGHCDEDAGCDWEPYCTDFCGYCMECREMGVRPPCKNITCGKCKLCISKRIDEKKKEKEKEK